MMRTSRLFIVLAAAGALVACTKPAGDAPQAGDAAGAPASATVATVNGKKITREMFDTFLQAVLGGSQQQPTDEQKAQLVDQLINMTLAAQAADKDGLAKDPVVAGKLELLRTQILAEATSERFVKSHPASEDEVKAEYDAQIAGMQKEYKARHILVENKETAESIIRELQAGGDFSKLAKEESKDSSGGAGGDLGWFSPQTMVKPFADAVAALDKGKYTTEPVQSEFGYHVIILDDVRSPEPPAFDDVKPQVEMFVQRKKLQAYLEGLRKEANIQK
jgi:peptidyl-prolyl cis-trans isomerase C